jgi:hypothetical protein
MSRDLIREVSAVQKVYRQAFREIEGFRVVR